MVSATFKITEMIVGKIDFPVSRFPFQPVHTVPKVFHELISLLADWVGSREPNFVF